MPTLKEQYGISRQRIHVLKHAGRWPRDPAWNGACVDGGACHLATIKVGIPNCTGRCGIEQSKSSWAWPRIVALAESGFAPCGRVVERATSTPTDTEPPMPHCYPHLEAQKYGADGKTLYIVCTECGETLRRVLTQDDIDLVDRAIRATSTHAYDIE